MQNKEQVVITGIGLVTPLGYNYKEVWRRFLDGANGIVNLESIDINLGQYNIHVGGGRSMSST